ncbi:MAG: TraB/GumN family protein [Methanomassiliicoccaceae archaeon]|nr:TraB/GumN family protein [Methanomassiliicoccaceae archaeon]
MITLLGTGHVFKIAEPVSFIIKNIWPDAVLVELDEKRYNALTSPPGGAGENNNSWTYRNMAEYQKSVAEENESIVGAELLAAAETGKMIGAAVEFIDKDAAETMNEAFKEMSFREKTRFFFSMIGDKFRSKKKAQTAVEEFAEKEEEYFEDLRKKYPTLVRKLIDERNEHMAGKINEASEKYENIVVVIGDGHVEGIAKLLSTANIRKIRLKTLMDKELMDTLRAELWSGKEEADGEAQEKKEQTEYAKEESEGGKEE